MHGTAGLAQLSNDSLLMHLLRLETEGFTNGPWGGVAENRYRVICRDVGTSLLLKL